MRVGGVRRSVRQPRGCSLCTCAESVANVLLVRAVNDKRFIRDAARLALLRFANSKCRVWCVCEAPNTAVCGNCCNCVLRFGCADAASESSLMHLLQHSNDRSAALCAVSSEFALQCIEAMGPSLGDCKMDAILRAVSRHASPPRPCALLV